jgi:hypothetical protein
MARRWLLATIALLCLRYPKLAPALADIVAFVSAPGATPTPPLEPAAAAQ